MSSISFAFASLLVCTNIYHNNTLTYAFTHWMIHNYDPQPKQYDGRFLNRYTCPTSTPQNNRFLHVLFSSQDEDILTTSLLEKIRSMRVREIKNQLDDVRISTTDCFEKEELVQRLYEYRLKIGSTEIEGGKSTTKSATGTTTKAKPATSTSPSTTTTTIRVPLDFHSLSTQSVRSQNADNLYLRPSPGKFPSIKVSLPSRQINNEKVTLNLLVDTACSGIILRPDVAKTLQLPTITTGVTMTAAGGTVGSNNNVYNLDCMQLNDENQTVLRDFVVVGQDIGALPPALDGIIGLSFLDLYHSVSFDFTSGLLILQEKENSKTEYDNPMLYNVIAETLLLRSRLGIYIAPMTLDGRGPVKMIVDTGAASTFLNWKGARDMNIDQTHPLVAYNRDAIGVMGADNTALALTHRFILKRRVNFDSSSITNMRGSGSTVGMFTPGLDIIESNAKDNENSSNSGVNIDIGDLPVLEAMKSEGVGGILGSDILMRCDVVHLENLKDRSSTKLTLFMKRNNDEKYKLV